MEPEYFAIALQDYVELLCHAEHQRTDGRG